MKPAPALPADPTPSATEQRGLHLSLGKLVLDNLALIILAIVLVLLAAFVPNFFTERNIGNVLVQAAPLALMAIGMAIVMITGGIDLSIPSVMSLAAILGDTPPAKLTFSCARDDGLREAIEKSGRQQIVVTGIEAHVCVLQTALDLLSDGYEVFVPYDAVNSRRKSDRKWALRRMASSGAIITTTESTLFELVERCDTAEFKTIAKLVKKLPV